MDGTDSVKRIMSTSHIVQEHICRLAQCSEQSGPEHVSRVRPETVGDCAADPNA